MSSKILGRWYLQTVYAISAQPQVENPDKQYMNSMYVLLEEDKTFSTYDSENNYNGDYVVEHEISGDFFEKGVLAFTTKDNTNFMKLCDSNEERAALDRCSDIIADLFIDKVKFQHFVKDNVLHIFTHKYLLICKRNRIFPPVYPPQTFLGSFLPNWFN